MFRKIKKILKWTGLTLLTIILLVSIVTASRQHLTYEAPYPNIKASTDSAVIARGRHLVIGPAHCVDCHSTANSDSLLSLGLDVPLSGGVKFDLPVGDIYSKNITPDMETGIGKLTDGEIARALRYGVHPDGTAVFDFMPFHNTSDEDLTAIISYIRSQKPVKNKVPRNNPNLLGNVVIAWMVKPVGPTGEVPASVKRDTSAAYGKYLAMSVAECNGCHTERDMSGGFIGQPFGGGGEWIEDGWNVTPPNLTPDSTSRIFQWSQKNFIDRFRMGKLVKQSHMPWNSFKRMDDDELKAIYNFLRSLPPVKHQTPLPHPVEVKNN